LRWTFVPLLVSPYFVDVAGKITTVRFNFLKFNIRQNIVVSFPEAVRDNVVSDDVTII